MTKGRLRMTRGRLRVTGKEGFMAKVVKGASGLSGLAVRAEVSAAVPQGNTLNGSTANRAGLAFPVSDLEIKMRCAQLTARADISVRAGSFPGDS